MTIRRTAQGLATAILALAIPGGAALAQPYDSYGRPPPGYGGPPPGPGYDRRPDYDRPRGYDDAGFHCEAFQPGPRGPRRFFCPTEEPRPLGSRCRCEGPLPPPGYPPYPPAFGRVVR